MKFSKIIVAALLAFLMLAALPLCVSAGMGTPVPDDVYEGWGDIPLLVIKINYTPDNGNNTLIKTTDDTYWSKILFSQEYKKSLWNFYDIVSCGHCHFIPATENYVNAAHNNVANDGIVEVSINYDHSGESNITSSNDRSLAVSAATEFVDFKSFDKNGNGSIDKGELAVVLLCAGLEATRAGASALPSVHAFQTNSSMSATSKDGTSIAIASGFVKFGEMMNSSTPLTVGTFCHELGHYLGTYDLYVNKTWGGSNSPAGAVSVMAAGGAGSAGANSGELTGTSPSYLDAFHIVDQGWSIPEVMTDGEYTLYSRQSTEGTYQISKINTLNPNDFNLLENRYFDSSNEYFDSEKDLTGTRGIIIWHVDYKAIAGSSSLTANNGSEIGVAALSATSPFPYNSGVFGVKGQVFDAHFYQFPGSMTWSTRMSEGQGDLFPLKIELLDDAGHEMKIKVTGTTTLVAPNVTNNYSKTANTITVSGKINELNGLALNGVTVALSLKADMSDATTLEITPNADGSYVALFSELTSNKNYYVLVTYHTDKADIPDFVTNVKTKTESTDTTHYNISFFRGLNSPDKAYSQKATVGEPISIKFPMNKEGSTFAGWYLDANFKLPFDVTVGKNDNEEIALYARWIENEKLVSVKYVGAEVQNVACYSFGAEGESVREAVPVAKAGKVFAGWFADEALTMPFDFEAEQMAGEVTIYAKWEDDIEETTTSSGDPAETTTASPAETTGSGDPVEPEPSGSPVGLIIGIVAAVVVIAAAVVFVLKKKKK